MGVHLHRKIKALILALLLASLVVPASCDVLLPARHNAGSVLAETVSPSVLEAYSRTLTTVSRIGAADKWSPESAWIVLGMARAGSLPAASAGAYEANIATILSSRESDGTDHPFGPASISDTQASDNARAVLALTAAGRDVTDVGGYNLLEPLSHMGYILQQGINGPIWSLLALDCGNYEIPVCSIEKAQASRDLLIEAILRAQKSSSGALTGWTFSGSTADVDMTCMALCALAPYYHTDPAVTASVDAALAWLSAAQQRDGSFLSGGQPTSESASQVITALTSLGIDPQKDPRFLKNSRSAADSLLSFYLDGGFKHVTSNYKINNMATVQAYYALVSLLRFQDGKNSLYVMSDASDGYQIVPVPEPKPSSTGSVSTTVSKQTKKPKKTKQTKKTTRSSKKKTASKRTVSSPASSQTSAPSYARPATVSPRTGSTSYYSRTPSAASRTNTSTSGQIRRPSASGSSRSGQAESTVSKGNQHRDESDDETDVIEEGTGDTYTTGENEISRPGITITPVRHLSPVLLWLALGAAGCMALAVLVVIRNMDTIKSRLAGLKSRIRAPRSGK